MLLESIIPWGFQCSAGGSEVIFIKQAVLRKLPSLAEIHWSGRLLSPPAVPKRDHPLPESVEEQEHSTNRPKATEAATSRKVALGLHNTWPDTVMDVGLSVKLPREALTLSVPECSPSKVPSLRL